MRSRRTAGICAVGLLGMLTMGLTFTAQAQGLAQVSVSGIPPVLSSPALSDIVVGFEQGRFPLTFVYNAPDRQPVEFILRFRLERDGEAVMDVTSDPVAFTRGVYVYTSFDNEPPITFPVAYDEVIAALGGSLQQDLDHTGVLSEGVYTLTVEATPADPGVLVLSVPNVSTFFVQYLEPPVTLGPQDDELIQDRFPLFSWMPVIGGPPGATFEYEFVLVEVYEGQEPRQAVESNRPIEQEVLTGRTSLPYTAERLPLEFGRMYAWQVTAADLNGLLPFTDNGRSEIATFTFAPSKLGIAAWEYPYSDPRVLFNLSGAQIVSDGYLVDGLFEGDADGAPVSGVFNQVLLHPVTLEIESGTVTILDQLAENSGTVDSRRIRSIVADATGPTAPFVSVRRTQAATGYKVEVVVGPSEDVESGITDVSLRMVSDSDGATQGASDAHAAWRSVLSSGADRSSVFAGTTITMGVPQSSVDELLAGNLHVEVRSTNGLGLHTLVAERISVATDRSPPVWSEPEVVYTGYYASNRPNAVELRGVLASDAESGVSSIGYRLLDPTGTVGVWTTIDEPGTRRFSAPSLYVPLSAVGTDGDVTLEVRVRNGAGLSTVWRTVVRVDIDDSQPELVGELAQFVLSDTNPRIEISRDAVADRESGVKSLEYRVVDDRRPTLIYVGWTPFPDARVAEVKRTQMNFTVRRSVRVEVRAENGAGLNAVFSAPVSVPELEIGDQTAPSTPPVDIRVVRSTPGGETVLEVRIGSSSDPETGISQVEYRVEDAATGTVLAGWTAASDGLGYEFSGSEETVTLRVPDGVSALRVTARATNGAGMTSSASSRVSIAAQDFTPPIIRNVDAYVQDDRILVFVDGLADEQSAIARLEYRLVTDGGATLRNWTAYPIVPAGRKSYSRQLVRIDVPDALPGPRLTVEIRVTNGAGQQTTDRKSIDLGR